MAAAGSGAVSGDGAKQLEPTASMRRKHVGTGGRVGDQGLISVCELWQESRLLAASEQRVGGSRDRKDACNVQASYGTEAR